MKGPDSLLIGCVYRSPSSDIVSSITCLCNLLRSVNGFLHLLICGDFNYSGIDWGILSPKSSGSPITQTYIDNIQDSDILLYSDILHQCTPLTNWHNKKNIYMSFDALRLKNRKNKSWTRYFIRRSKSNYDFDRYRQARNDLRSFTRSLRSDYERNLSLNVKQNPKAFWKYINSRLKVYPTINDLQCSDGSILYIGYFCTSSRNCNSKSPGPDG